MDKEFLEGLGLTPEAVEAVLHKQQEVSDSHAREVMQIRFDASLEREVSAAGGKNLKAIRALLDVDALAENPEGIGDAVKNLKKECAYLFESPLPPAYAAGTGTCRGEVTAEPKSLADALREKFKKK